MDSKQKYLESLISRINKRFGYTPTTPTDFTRLAVRIEQTTGTPVSESTLKRVWGYVKSDGFPSPATLNRLCAFLGYADWGAFTTGAQVMESSDSSGFLDAVMVSASDLKKGDRLRLDWAPEKGLIIECVGEEEFRVVEAFNVKLQPGDRFRCKSVSVGMPFYAVEIRRGKQAIPGYVGARPEGVSSIHLLPPPKINLQNDRFDRYRGTILREEP